jgi:hypothetical protein
MDRRAVEHGGVKQTRLNIIGSAVDRAGVCDDFHGGLQKADIVAGDPSTRFCLIWVPVQQGGTRCRPTIGYRTASKVKKNPIRPGG